jgi:membrane associated rhomboid family serine protease
MAWQDRDYNRDGPGFGPMGRVSARSVTFWLIAVCVAVFALDALLGVTLNARGGFPSGPLTAWGAFRADAAVYHAQVWRFLSFQFLHANVWHILFNMIGLYFFGRFIESFLGPRRYLALYLLSGVGGALFYLVLLGLGSLPHTQRVPFLLGAGAATQLVGASAGIFGVLVACAVIAPHQRVNLVLPPITLSIRALALILLGLAGFFLLAGGSNAGGEAAHLGGAAIGFVLIRYPRLLGFADRIPTDAFARLAEKQRLSAARRRQRRDQAEDAQVDRILAKVKEHGLHSLSEAEKRTLQRATDRHRRAG